MRYAVFVDAGYLYAQGSKALAHQSAPRDYVDLDLPAIIGKLRIVADYRAPASTLLRFYWYDGLVKGRLSRQQEALAHTEDVKLRLGIVTPAGRQKGVDSLIVTDLVELARNGAISDAIMLSGDEDLRICVQIAQSLGVRVHLIGIQPSRGSQSLTLLQEADTTTEWSTEEVSEFLTIRPGFDGSGGTPEQVESPARAASLTLAIGQVVDEFVSSLDAEDVRLLGGIEDVEPVPRAFDSRLLATCRNRLDRDLDDVERSEMRKTFRERVKDRLKGL